MRRAVAAVFVLCLAAAASAQQKVDLLFDLEGVHRTGGAEPAVALSGSVYTPEFDNGGGIGGGVNWYFNDRVSLELKIAALLTGGTIEVREGDFVGVLELDTAQIYPITAVFQWHPFETGGTFRPYVGAGVSHIILRNIGRTDATPGLEFDDPTGLALNGGVRAIVSKRWSLYGDVKYIALETSSRVRLDGADVAEGDLDVRPLVVAFGLAYHF